jgi:hypothetical protein
MKCDWNALKFDWKRIKFDWNALKFDWKRIKFDWNALKFDWKRMKIDWKQLKLNCTNFPPIPSSLQIKLPFPFLQFPHHPPVKLSSLSTPLQIPQHRF